MPIHTARPSGPGDLTEWDSVNVSGPALANWQAVAALSSNQFVIAPASGRRDRYVVPNLPASAVGVSLVTVYVLLAGDDVGEVRLALRLAGVESYGTAVVPPNGGYALYFFEFPLAPGGLAWTVARRNAIQFGPDSVSVGAGDAPNLDEAWIETSYVDPVATALITDRQTIASPGAGRASIPCDARRISLPSPGGGRATLTCPQKRVDVVSPLAGRATIPVAPERD